MIRSLSLIDFNEAFKVINSRGFNSTSPVRSLQLIDGVDNQAPGLNFALGNFLGASDLDVMKVEIIQGASSAYYGPGAFNGVINITTKDPFYILVYLFKLNMVNVIYLTIQLDMLKFLMIKLLSNSTFLIYELMIGKQIITHW